MISIDLVFGCPTYLPCDYHFASGKIIKVFFSGDATRFCYTLLLTLPSVKQY